MVKDFGPVTEAIIETAPLVLIVGRNNTGKSYITSLMWAMMSSEGALFRGRQMRTPSWFREAFAAALPNKPHVLALDGTLVRSIESSINTFLRREKANVAADLLGFPDAAVGSLRLSNVLKPNELKVEFGVLSDQGAGSSVGPSGTGTWWRPDGDGWTSQLSVRRDASDLVDLFYTQFISSLLGSIAGSAAYLPANRAGLMSVYKLLLRDSLSRFGFRRPDGEPLPRPIIHFLESLLNLSNGPPGPLQDLATTLEHEVMGGGIEVSAAEVPDFRFRPDGATLEIPLQATSSLVVELAPFVRQLRTGAARFALVVEEPEAHLHLSAQRQLAEILAQLVKLGVRVVVTTHSDTFVQQINILIARYSLFSSDRAERRADAILTLSPDLVRGYEFLREGTGTTARNLRVTPEGFVVPSLNDELQAQAAELIDLEKGLG